jgi:CheY-like chemotaxis protein
MPITIGSVSLRKVLVVDDDPEARKSLGYLLEDMEIEPVLQDDRLDGGLDEVVSMLRGKADAMVSDYHLHKKANYSKYEGDALVASANRQHFPALLCTSYADSANSISRLHRRFIPALLPTGEYEIDAIQFAFTRCIEEDNGKFAPARRPWRTLVRVEEVNASAHNFYVVVSAWSAEQKIRIMYPDVPDSVCKALAPGKQFHASVNTGAINASDLYFNDWELQ